MFRIDAAAVRDHVPAEDLAGLEHRLRLIVSTRSQSWSVASRNVLPALTPAQFTRISARPVCWRVAASSFSSDSRWVTSTVT